MIRSFANWRAFIVACCLVCCYSSFVDAANAKTLHLISVGDLRGGDNLASPDSWRRTISNDVKAIRTFFESNLSVDSFKYYEIDGELATPDAIRKTIAQINAAPDDVIVFYYSGHAANDPEKNGQYLQLLDSAGKNAQIDRIEIRDLLKAKGAKFTVLITDCCNPFCPSELWIDSSKGEEKSTLFNQLFFGPIGLFDYTSSTIGQSSYTGKDGGNSIGTYALLKALQEFTEKVENDPSLVVTWRDVVVRATVISDEEFKNAGLESSEQKTQKPHVYEWPGVVRFGVRAMGLESGGVKVTEVFPDFPGDKAGFQIGDVIVSIAGKAIDNEDLYSDEIDAIGAEAQSVPMEYLRNGEKFSVNVDFLDAYKASPPVFGASVGNGNVVSRVIENSPAADAGLERGDGIVKFNGVNIKSSVDFSRAVDSSPTVAKLDVRKRNGVTKTVDVYLNKLKF